MSSTTTTLPVDTSWSSLTSPRKSKAASEISKTFKYARDLFLQRRLSEAFATIEPLVTRTRSEVLPDEDDSQAEPTLAPVASASRILRIKIWSLYITLLNAIADLGPEEGKEVFGNKEWKNVLTKVESGTVWEDVVNTGYAGLEGNVDIDVVINL